MNLYSRAVRWLIRNGLSVVFRVRAPHYLKRLGSEYGGWTVPVQSLNSNSICYSFGAGEDITFDLALAEQTGSEVYLFDPTPRSAKHFQLVTKAHHGDPDAAQELQSTYGDVRHKPVSSLVFHKVGVWIEDTELDFFEPRDPNHVSHSIVNVQNTKTGFIGKVQTVRSIASMLRHETVDLIKLDIEGAELAVIEDLLAHGPLPRILCVEFDAVANGSWREFLALRVLVRRLASHELRLAHIENWNFLFLGQLKNNVL